MSYLMMRKHSFLLMSEKVTYVYFIIKYSRSNLFNHFIKYMIIIFIWQMSKIKLRNLNNLPEDHTVYTIHTYVCTHIYAKIKDKNVHSGHPWERNLGWFLFAYSLLLSSRYTTICGVSMGQILSSTMPS